MIEPTPQAQEGRGSVDYGWVVVVASSVVMLVSFGLIVSYGLFLNPFQEEFGWSRAAISGAYSLSNIVAGTVGLLAGVLTDRLGPRMVVTASGLLFGAGAILMSQVDDLWELYLFFGVLIGAGMSGMWVPPLSTVARWFGTRRSLATGIVLSGMTVGQVIVPLAIGRLISSYGWRHTYLIFGIVALATIVIGAQFLRRDPATMSRRANAGKAGGGQVAGLSCRKALCTRQFWMVSAIFFFVGMAAFGLLIHLAPRAISLGISEIDSANLLAVTGAVGIAGSFLLGGMIGHRFGDRRAFIVGLMLVMAALLLLLPTEELWAFYACSVIFGLGMSGMAASESPLVAELFGLSQHGSIYAATGIGYTAGAALGPLVFGLIFDSTGGYDPALLLGVAFGAIALVLLLVLRPRPEAVSRGA